MNMVIYLLVVTPISSLFNIVVHIYLFVVEGKMCVETQALIQPGELCIFQCIYLFVFQIDHHDHCVTCC